MLEGVAYGLKDGFRLIQNAGLGQITQIRASGGGVKSPLWRQILASGLNAELVTVNTAEGGAYGAALLAGVGVGAWSDTQKACDSCIKVTGSTQPDQAQVEIYQNAYPVFQELYPVLKESFTSLSRLESTN